MVAQKNFRQSSDVYALQIHPNKTGLHWLQTTFSGFQIQTMGLHTGHPVVLQRIICTYSLLV